MELIQQDEFFDVSDLDVIRFSREDHENRMDALISSAYVINPQDWETMRNSTMQDWLIAEDPIRAKVAAMDKNLDENIFDLALSDRLEFSKLDMSIESMKENNGSCEFFEVDMRELWSKVNVTSAKHPKGVTSEML